MENTKTGEFVLKISALWNDQKRREGLYLEALKKDSMSSLRRMLTQGHFSALLFQKEIRWIYDYFKCLLTDKELEDLNQKGLTGYELMRDMEDKEQIAGFLKKSEGTILQSYKSLIGNLESDSETRKVLDDHLDRISEFYEILSKQEYSNLKGMSYSTAA
jgi:hypothetical protein